LPQFCCPFDGLYSQVWLYQYLLKFFLIQYSYYVFTSSFSCLARFLILLEPNENRLHNNRRWSWHMLQPVRAYNGDWTRPLTLPGSNLKKNQMGQRQWRHKIIQKEKWVINPRSSQTTRLFTWLQNLKKAFAKLCLCNLNITRI